MSSPARICRGFSLVELLLVLVIIGTLVTVGVATLGNRQGDSVRAQLDAVEEALTNAHRQAMSSGRDTAVDTWGTWSTANQMVLAFGDAALTDTQIQNTAQGLLQNPPVLPSNANLAYSQTVTAPLFYQTPDPINDRSCIVVAGNGAWNEAMVAAGNGQVNQNINQVAPFTGATFAGLVADANNLFQGGAAPNRKLISGLNLRFASTFIVEVVAISPGGFVMPGGAMGLIVVLANGDSIYKFYNPGVMKGNGQWRRI
jgi:prepilin-type N-terminal cleavage/methylation domain-containing protein